MLKTCSYICLNMTTSIPIRYKKAWTNIYILVGLVCVTIFLLGFFIVGDPMNVLFFGASIVPIYLGFNMKKQPYAVVSRTKIEVFGLFGELKHEYISDENTRFVNRNGKISLDGVNTVKKIKMNKWFVNQSDWNAVLELFK